MHKEFDLEHSTYKFAYELDFSGFDSSQTKQHYQIEMAWYKIMFEKWIKTTASEEYTND